MAKRGASPATLAPVNCRSSVTRTGRQSPPTGPMRLTAEQHIPDDWPRTSGERRTAACRPPAAYTGTRPIGVAGGILSERPDYAGCSRSNLAGRCRRSPRPAAQVSSKRRTALPLNLPIIGVRWIRVHWPPPRASQRKVPLVVQQSPFLESVWRCQGTACRSSTTAEGTVRRRRAPWGHACEPGRACRQGRAPATCRGRWPPLPTADVASGAPRTTGARSESLRRAAR